MKILLCPPRNYSVEYEINPWMDKKNTVDQQKTLYQFDQLKRVYSQLKIKTIELESQKGLNDQVFTTDLGHVENRTFIKANFRFPERQKESVLGQEFFQQKGFKIEKIPDHIKWEGGDFLKLNNEYFLGWGIRSDFEAAEKLEGILKKKVTPLEIVNEYYFHLDTCLLPLDENSALVNLGAFSKDSANLIQKRFRRIIHTRNKDNISFATNMIRYKNYLVVGEGLSDSTKKLLEMTGFEVITTPMSEYYKGGGSVHCVSLEIFD